MPLSRGQQAGTHELTLAAPDLEVCLNAYFDESGIMKKRLPFSALAGSALTNPRSLASYKSALIAFTDDSLYSYSDTSSGWKKQADYVAPVVAEEQTQVRTTDQVAADRAELGGVVYHTWLELGGDGAGWYFSMVDAETGTQLYGPALFSADAADRLKLVAGATRVALVNYDDSASTTTVRMYNPADTTGTSITGGTVAAVTSGLMDAMYSATETAFCGAGTRAPAGDDGYAWRLTEAAAFTTNDFGEVGVAVTGPVAVTTRTADQGITVAFWSADDNTVRRVQANSDLAFGTSVVWDTTASQPRQLAIIANLNSGDNIMYATIAEDAADNANFTLRMNIDLGTTEVAARQLSLASKPFAYGNDTYVWLVFASANAVGSGIEELGYRAQLQNTYFLLRQHDSNPVVYSYVGKAVSYVAGGFAHLLGLLPEVQNTSGNKFKWAGIQRRLVPLGDDAFDRIRRLRPPNPGSGLDGTGGAADPDRAKPWSHPTVKA